MNPSSHRCSDAGFRCVGTSKPSPSEHDANLPLHLLGFVRHGLWLLTHAASGSRRNQLPCFFQAEVDAVEHLIPLTPSIVLKVDKRQRCLVINPPEGLLELGRQQSLLMWLKPQLEVPELRDAVLVSMQPLR